MAQQPSIDLQELIERLNAQSLQNAQIINQNAKLIEENAQIKAENAQLKAENSDLREKVDMIAADVRDIKGKMRDSRLAIAKSAASHDLALQMILFMKYASGVVGFLYIVALGLAIASGNLLGIAQMLVGWFSVIPSLMALYLLAKKNIEDHEANLYNETELLRSYDDLLNSKKTD